MSRSGQETLPDVRKWSGGPPRCPLVVGRSSRMFGSGRHTLPDVREWSDGPPGCPRVARSGREALSNVWEWPEVVGRLYRMFGSGREAIPDDCDWSAGSPGCPGVDGRGSQMSVIREDLPTTNGHQGGPPDHFRTSGRASRPHLDIREGLPTTPGDPEVIGRPSRMSRSGRVAVPDVREWSGVSPGCTGVAGCGRESLPNVRERSGSPPRCLGVVGRPSWLTGVVRRPSRMHGSGREFPPNVRV